MTNVLISHLAAFGIAIAVAKILLAVMPAAGGDE